MTVDPRDQFVYSNAEDYPRVGDRVRFINDGDVLTVDEVIDSEEKRSKWNLNESGLMLKGGKYGLVFTSDIKRDLELISAVDVN
jgi:hypothetical protein